MSLLTSLLFTEVGVGFGDEALASDGLGNCPALNSEGQIAHREGNGVGGLFQVVLASHCLFLLFLPLLVFLLPFSACTRAFRLDCCSFRSFISLVTLH